jgi:hypothetical protein
MFVNKGKKTLQKVDSRCTLWTAIWEVEVSEQ